MEQGEFSLAETMFEQSKNVFGDIGHQQGICALDRYCGVLAYRMGNLELASKYYENALHIAKLHQYTGMIAEIRNLQGSLARKRDDFESARQLYEESKQEVAKLGDQWRLTAVLRNLARMEFQLGNLETAKNRFHEVITLCREIDRKDMLYGCLLSLAEVQEEYGDQEEARALAVKARNGFAELGMENDLARAIRFLDYLS
jgi:tetratricopeptide (TPR) repeat protein